MLWFILVIICALAEAWMTEEDNVRMGSFTVAGVAALAMATNIVFLVKQYTTHPVRCQCCEAWMPHNITTGYDKLLQNSCNITCGYNNMRTNTRTPLTLVPCVRIMRTRNKRSHIGEIAYVTCSNLLDKHAKPGSLILAHNPNRLDGSMSLLQSSTIITKKHLLRSVGERGTI